MSPNLYCILVTSPGLRKSTPVQLVTHIASNLLLEEAFFSGVTGNQALFLEYLKHPDKLWLIDEGNVILDNWAHDAAGRGQGDPGGSADKHLDPDRRDLFERLLQRPGDPRWNLLAVQLLHGRALWALSFCSHELIEFTGLEAFKGLRGEIRLSAEARQAWNALQRKNRRQIEEERGIDAASETYGSVLASSPDKIPEVGDGFRGCSLAQGQGKELAGHPGGHPGSRGQARGLLRRGEQKPRRDCEPRGDPG